MPRVYIGCFGSGLGHASRMLEVAGALRDRGWEVEMSSSGEVATMIEARGYRCNRLPLADVKYSATGEFAMKQTLVSSPWILARTYHQVELEVSHIQKFGPGVVLSDSALSTVLAARILRLPTVTVLNQLNLTSSHGGQGAPARLLSVGTSSGMGKLWEFSDEVLLPDLPPPYTISEKNLWGSNVEKTRYVWFLTPSGKGVPDAAGRGFAKDPRVKVFWQVSGPPQTRAGLVKQALDLAGRLSDRFVFVVSGGNPSADGGATPFAGGWYYSWCGISEYYFAACDAIISRAGHGTIGQTIASGKPSLIIPIPRQPEQEGNAEKAARLGVSIVLPQERLALESLRESLGALVDGGFGESARRLGAWASGFNAKDEVVRTLESAAASARPERR
ncbi:MAG: hypothetical protein HY297_00520 [Thaumarchaeota archaeon]|nr:hypothetical protein [Nitrososphaerota archaeon]